MEDKSDLIMLLKEIDLKEEMVDSVDRVVGSEDKEVDLEAQL
jgi:hypothetical protein